MPTRVEQTESMEAGHVRLICQQSKQIDPDTLEIGMARLDRGTPHFLDPAAQADPVWVAGERWFKPDAARLEGQTLLLELGPTLTWRLKPHMAYLLHLRDGSGARIEDRLAWPAVRLPSSPPEPQAAETRPPEPPPPVEEPETPLEPAALPASDADDLAAFAAMAATAPAAPLPDFATDFERERRPAPPTTAGRSLILPLLLVLIAAIAAAGGAYWWYYLRAPNTSQQAAAPPPATAQPTVPLTLEGARAYLSQQKPAAADAAREAQRFAAAGQADGAFLLYRQAAREGDVPSMLAIARMYDPATFKPGQGPVAKADADEASTWYEQAANKGSVEAMQRLSTLLKDPNVTRPDAAERATFWQLKAEAAAKSGTAPAAGSPTGASP